MHRNPMLIHYGWIVANNDTNREQGGKEGISGFRMGSRRVFSFSSAIRKRLCHLRHLEGTVAGSQESRVQSEMEDDRGLTTGD
jgi:hypothetical protein